MVLLESFLLVLLTETGDKTQLLALMLALRYQRPWMILLGILVATVANHLLAALLGTWVQAQLSPETLKWILTTVFLGFAAWVLVPDQMEESKLDKNASSAFRVFGITAVAFFIAEIGDKTQLATVALAAKFQDVVWVTAGTTLGMLVADGMAVFLGEKLNRKIPLNWVRIFSALMFIFMAIALWAF